MRKMIIGSCAAALFCVQPASATNLWCTGVVKGMYVDSSQAVFALGEWNTNWSMVCSLSTTWKGISPDLCKTWFAMLQGAYHAQSRTTVNYWGSAYATCAEIPSYGSAPAPSYVMNAVAY